MAIEFELKFRATPEQLTAIGKTCSGQTQSLTMETTYYDTPDGDLSARKYTLRRRMENDTSVCTLKIPATGGGRNEFELECDTIKAALPELCKLSGLPELPALLAKGIAPICGAQFHRTAILLERPDCTVELALDEGILTGGGKQIPLCEVEVELKSGSREGAVAYAAMLQSAFCLVPEKRSKFRRALALAKGEL